MPRDEDSSSSADSGNVGQRPAVKLPKLEIVKFRGDYTKWQRFIDSFKAVIHSSATQSNIDKFNYLQCYVAGDALNTIEGLSLTNDNYIKALELLEDRYGNKQAIITAHMKNLLKLRRVESNLNVISLRRLYDDVQAHVRSPKKLRNYRREQVLLDAGSQRTYISEKIRKFLNFFTEALADVNISTFGNSQTLSISIDRVLLIAKTNSHERFVSPCYVSLYRVQVSHF